MVGQITPSGAPHEQRLTILELVSLTIRVRGVEAIVKLATVAPLPIVRSSGSAVRLPTMVMTVSPAITVLLTYLEYQLFS